MWSGPKEKGYCCFSKCGFLLVLYSLPWTMYISENNGPGTVLRPFSFNCSSYMPTLELLSVRPPTSFFNKPSMHGDKGVYLVMVRPWIQLGIVGTKARSGQRDRKPRPYTSFVDPPQVSLSSSARLDALAVNQYELQLQYRCGNFVVDGSIFVHVQRDPGRIRCTGAFASPGEPRSSGLGEER
jgi:cadherin-related family protein 4